MHIGSFVPNSDWNGYAADSPHKPPGWTPPPPPAPECVPGPSACYPAPTGSVFPPPGDFPPGCNHKGCTTVPTLLPTWTPTYQMNKSTIIMPCNDTGPTDPQSTKGWAYVDFDWSNWKGTGTSDGWAKAKPMDCEERMVKQVQMTVAASPDTKGEWCLYQLHCLLPCLRFHQDSDLAGIWDSLCISQHDQGFALVHFRPNKDLRPAVRSLVYERLGRRDRQPQSFARARLRQ